MKVIEKDKLGVRLNQIKANLASMTLTAPADGMVIYGDHWMERRKIQVGDMVPCGEFELKRMESELDEIVVSMKSPEALKPSAVLINEVLTNMHGKAEDFSIIVPRELFEQNQQTRRKRPIDVQVLAHAAARGKETC